MEVSLGPVKPPIPVLTLGLGASIVLGGCCALWLAEWGGVGWMLLVWAVATTMVAASLAMFFAHKGEAADRASEGWVCIALAAVGAVIWLGAAPKESGQMPEFRIVESGAPAEISGFATWDETSRGIRMHAPLDDRNGVRAPSKIVADISAGRTAPRVWRFRYTQPQWTVFDPEGRVRTGPDGVEVRVLAIDSDGESTEIYRSHINPFSHAEDRSWRSSEAQVPRGAAELALQVTPGPAGSNTFNDHLFVEPGPLSRSGKIGQLRQATGLGGGWGGRFSALLIALGALHMLCSYAGRRWLGYDALSVPTERGRGRLPARLIGVAAAVLLAIGAAIALWTAPHASSWTTPVLVELDGGADASLTLGWSQDRDDRVPLVRHERESAAAEFVGVLPARRHYDGVLSVRAGDEPVGVRSVVFIDVRDPADRSRAISPEGTSVAPGETLNLDLGRVGQPPTSRVAWFGWVTALFAIGAVSFMAMCFGALRAPAGTGAPGVRWPSSGTVLVLVVWTAASAMHLLATIAQPVAVSADSRMYLLQALGLLHSGDAHIGGTIYTLNRMPGYAATIAPLLWAGAMSLTVIAVFQALLYSGAVLMLAWACRRWLAPWLAAVAIAAAMLTPPALWSSVQILTESLFTSLVLIAVASLLLHAQSGGRRSLLWLGAFSLAAACTVLVRPNGILLLPLCVAAGVPVVMHRFWSGRGSASSALAAIVVAVPYVLACAAPVAAATAWASRNQDRFGFPHSTDMRAITDVVGLMASGVLDPRSLDDDAYRLYAQGLRRMHYGYHIWHLRDDFTTLQASRGRTLDSEWISEIDAWTKRIVSDSQRRSPTAFRAVAMARTAYWTLLTPDPGYDGIRRTGRQPWFPKNVDERWIETTEQSIRGVDPQLVYDRRTPPRWLGERVAPLSHLAHHPVHNLLFVLASICGVVLVTSGRIWLALPWLFYLGCTVINIYLGNFRPRYTHPMEALLLFQVGLGISSLVAQASNRRGRPSDALASEKASAADDAEPEATP